MKLLGILFVFVGFTTFGQSNKLFSKKYEQAIASVRNNESVPKIIKIQSKDYFEESALTQIENILVDKKGFYDFEINHDGKIISIFYLSFIDKVIIESIVEKVGLKFKVISDEVDEKLMKK